MGVGGGLASFVDLGDLHLSEDAVVAADAEDASFLHEVGALDGDDRKTFGFGPFGDGGDEEGFPDKAGPPLVTVVALDHFLTDQAGFVTVDIGFFLRVRNLHLKLFDLFLEGVVLGGENGVVFGGVARKDGGGEAGDGSGRGDRFAGSESLQGVLLLSDGLDFGPEKGDFVFGGVFSKARIERAKGEREGRHKEDPGGSEEHRHHVHGGMIGEYRSGTIGISEEGRAG